MSERPARATERTAGPSGPSPEATRAGDDASNPERPAAKLRERATPLRRRPYALALVGWTFFVWTTRIANVWRDEALDAGEKLGRTGLALSFTLLAVAAAVTLWRRSGRAELVAVGALAGWSVAVWVVRDVRILTGDHDTGFKAVHTVLAVVSIVLAVLAWREARRDDRQVNRQDERRVARREADGPISAPARR